MLNSSAYIRKILDAATNGDQHKAEQALIDFATEFNSVNNSSCSKEYHRISPDASQLNNMEEIRRRLPINDLA
jgi:hypothetical protein